MLFSCSAEYAMRGLAELASRQQDTPVMLDDVVAAAQLPRDFLAKIFQKLVHAGLLKSSKGRGGGFSLARPPEQITLMDIIDAVDRVTEHRMPPCCPPILPGIAGDRYELVRVRLRECLQNITVADLMTVPPDHVRDASMHVGAQ
jgi:Rrf2 family protein